MKEKFLDLSFWLIILVQLLGAAYLCYLLSGLCFQPCK